jgi:S-formylglutathione hydrolase FrmB
VLGGIAAGVAALDACAAPPTGATSDATRPTPESLTGPTGIAPEQVSTEQLHSTARGTQVELVMIKPPIVGDRLPVCLALHGRSSTARMFLDLGVPAMLNAAVAAGVPPFAVVAVDGGDSYWVAKRPTDDPQRMLTEDVPTWLGNRGLATKPFAAFGISMGGYGALNYARNAELRTAVAISAALFDNWTEAKSRNAFADEASWEATEPLRHTDKLRSVPLGVWCGTSDPFINQARQLIEQTNPRKSAIGPGGHEEGYWRRILPDVLRYVGESQG